MHIHVYEAGGLLCSLTGIFKIHLSDSDIKAHVPEPLVYKRSKLYVYTVLMVLGALFQSLGSIFC